MTDRLRLVLSEIQRRGAIGRGDLDAAIEHADQFADLVGDATTVIDLGSGGGLPGLVVAWRRPLAQVRLVERRAKRADLLRFGVTSLGMERRVAVDQSDVDHLISAGCSGFDVVTARSFGPPRIVARAAALLLRPGGTLLVSEPPFDDERWAPTLLAAWGLRDGGRSGGIRVVHRVDAVPRETVPGDE